MRCKRVVLADQHPVMLEGIRRMLETEAESVLMLADEASLMQAVETALPDLVIADLSFPVSGGTNVARLLKQWHPDIKVIILSVHEDPAAVNEVAAAGAEAFFNVKAISSCGYCLCLERRRFPVIGHLGAHDASQVWFERDEIYCID